MDANHVKKMALKNISDIKGSTFQSMRFDLPYGVVGGQVYELIQHDLVLDTQVTAGDTGFCAHGYIAVTETVQEDGHQLSCHDT